MLLVSMVIVNVVLATLLDEFLKAAATERNVEAMGTIGAAEKKRLENLRSSLDPLLLSWARESDSMGMLAQKIQGLFRALDVDGSGELDYEVKTLSFIRHFPLFCMLVMVLLESGA